MNKVIKFAEWVVFVLYCAMPLSLILGFFVQDGKLFMNTVFGFGFAYVFYGHLLQFEKEVA